MSVSHKDVPIGADEFTSAHLDDLLTMSRDLITDEARWCTGSFLRMNIGATLKAGEDPALCTDARVCAMGAVAVVRFDGVITQQAYADTDRVLTYEDVIERLITDDPMADQAKALLHAAAKMERFDSIYQLNDAIGPMAGMAKRRAHLVRVIQAFDRARDLARTGTW